MQNKNLIFKLNFLSVDKNNLFKKVEKMQVHVKFIRKFKKLNRRKNIPINFTKLFY